MTNPEISKTKESVEKEPDQFSDERKNLAQEVTTDKTKKSTEKLNASVEAKDKQELIDLMKKDDLDFKSIDGVEKATEKYGKIMDKWGLDTVLGWVPGGDFASSAFSTLYFLYQGQKLPSGKKLGMIDTLKIFGLQVIDGTIGTTAKVVGTGGGLAGGALIGTAIAPGVGTLAGATVGAVGGFFGSSTLFDYFFKANKWSANIFQKHCDTLKHEAQTRKNNALYKSLETESKLISDKFSGKSEEKLKRAA